MSTQAHTPTTMPAWLTEGTEELHGIWINPRHIPLIAAARDMLAALKDCLPLFDLVACGEVQERVAVAVAKAEGRS